MDKNLARKIRILIKLNEELNQETYLEGKIDIIKEILQTAGTLKQFKKDVSC